MTSTITRTLSVSLPEELVGHVDVLHPTTTFVEPNARPLAPPVTILDKRVTPVTCNSSVASGVVTPACLQDLYGIPATAATSAGNALLVTAYEDQFAQSADLSVRAFLPASAPR